MRSVTEGLLIPPCAPRGGVEQSEVEGCLGLPSSLTDTDFQRPRQDTPPSAAQPPPRGAQGGARQKPPSTSLCSTPPPEARGR